MPSGAKPKLGRREMLMLAAMGALALFVAFVVGPAISQATGLPDQTISLALGFAFLVVAVGATLAARALNKKNSGK